MDFLKYLYAISIVVLLIAISLLLLIFLPKPKVYFSPEDIFKELNNLQSYSLTIKEELKNIHDNDYTNDKLIMYDKTLNYSIPSKTLEVLRSIPNIERVFLKKFPKKFKEDDVMGNALHSNKSLRCILPITIPASKKSGLWVNGETKFFEDNLIIYDNSNINSIFNKHKRKGLYLLFIDIVRPENIPLGISNNDSGY